MDLFWSQGYEATGMAELCDHMGVGRQSLYNTFGDKETLFTEALVRYQKSRMAPFMAMLNAPGSGLANIHAVLDLWESASKDMCSRGCLMANSIAEFGMREPKLSNQLSKMLREMEEGFTRALKRAKAEGELREDLDPKGLARLLTTVGQGLSGVGKLDPGGSFAKDAVASMRTLLK